MLVPLTTAWNAGFSGVGKSAYDAPETSIDCGAASDKLEESP